MECWFDNLKFDLFNKLIIYYLIKNNSRNLFKPTPIQQIEVATTIIYVVYFFWKLFYYRKNYFLQRISVATSLRAVIWWTFCYGKRLETNAIYFRKSLFSIGHTNAITKKRRKNCSFWLYKSSIVDGIK